MKKLILLTLMAIAIQIQAQNVGIGNPSPAEKLDVTGNINVTGTIKANGLDGTAGQILMKNNSGILTWGDACEYKNFKIIKVINPNNFQVFTIPAGVSKIKVQLWGGGGKGLSLSSGNSTSGAGGGGGGYLEAVLNVTAGHMLNIIAGEGATEGNALTSGTNSIIGYPDLGYSIYAYGGNNTSGLASAISAGEGGGFNSPATLTTAIGKNGEAGKPTTINIQYLGTSTAGVISLGRETTYGNGGNAGNTTGTGGQGRYLYMVGASIYSDTYGGGQGNMPGGGGSATIIATKNEEDGANGMVIVYW